MLPSMPVPSMPVPSRPSRRREAAAVVSGEQLPPPKALGISAGLCRGEAAENRVRSTVLCNEGDVTKVERGGHFSSLPTLDANPRSPSPETAQRQPRSSEAVPASHAAVSDVLKIGKDRRQVTQGTIDATGPPSQTPNTLSSAMEGGPAPLVSEAHEADTHSVGILRHMQELLQSGVPTSELQRWVSRQLLHAQSRDGCGAVAAVQATNVLSANMAPPAHANTTIPATTTAELQLRSTDAGVDGPLPQPESTLSGGSGGTLKMYPPISQQSAQWRSMHSSQGDAARHNSPHESSRKGAARQTAMARSIPSAASLPAHLNSARVSPHDRPASLSLQSSTKAALHAATSLLVSQEQQSISLLIGERFSRNPEDLLRHVRSPGKSVSSDLTLTPDPTTSLRKAAPPGRGTSDRVDISKAIATNTASSSILIIERSTSTAETRSPPMSDAPPLLMDVVPTDENLPSEASSASTPPSFHRSRVSTSPQMKVSCPSTAVAQNMRMKGSSQGERPASPLIPVAEAAAHRSGSDLSARQRSNGTPRAISPVAAVEESAKLRRTRPQSREERQGSLLLTPSSNPLAATAASPSLPVPPTAAHLPPNASDAAAASTPDIADITSLDGSPADDVFPVDSPAGLAHRPPLDSGSATTASRCQRASPFYTFAPALPVMLTSTPLPTPQSPNSAPYQQGGTAETPLAGPAFLPPSSCPQSHPLPVASRQMTSFVSPASSHAGYGWGANGGQGAMTPSSLPGRSFTSLREDAQSLCSIRAAGDTSLGDNGSSGGRGDIRLRNSAVLHLSHSAMNGNFQNNMEGGGVMASFILDNRGDAEHHAGPRFLRSYCRHTAVRVPESVTLASLSRLGMPFIDDIDSASTPTNVLTIMRAYGYVDGRAFYVAVCLNVLLRYALVQRFGWDLFRLRRFFEAAATFFRDGNPFHHTVHAVDVIIAAHQWLSEGSTAVALSDDEVMTFLLTAMVRQLAHTGAENRLLAQLKHPYAMLCSYGSPQQGVTVALVMALLADPELRFFPDALFSQSPVVCDRGSAGAMEPQVTHEWTAGRESKMYDMLAELIMATDSRDHVALKDAIMNIGEENARRHGCLCATVDGDRAESLSDASKYPNPASYPYGASARMQEPSSRGTFCLRCCAYVADAHVPDLLKAVLHFIDYSYIFRPYDIYVSGNVAYVAEVYRQSELEYRVLRHLRDEQRKRMLAGTATSGKEGEGSDTASRVPCGDSQRSKDASASSCGTSTDPNTPATTFVTALMKEKELWRQSVAHASTIASLLRQAEGVPSNLIRQPAEQMVVVGEGVPEVPASLSSSLSSLEGAMTEEKHGDGGEAEEKAADASTSTLVRVQPLSGCGRDIILISLQELCVPFLEQLAPYVPEAWVRYSCENHNTFLRNMPNPQELDAALHQLLCLGELTEEEKAEEEEHLQKPEMEESDEATTVKEGQPFTLPWALLRPLRPIARDLTLDADGLVRRVLQTIMKVPNQTLAELTSGTLAQKQNKKENVKQTLSNMV